MADFILTGYQWKELLKSDYLQKLPDAIKWRFLNSKIFFIGYKIATKSPAINKKKFCNNFRKNEPRTPIIRAGGSFSTEYVIKISEHFFK